VRDVAAAHVWAIGNPAVSDGQRYIVAAGLGPPQAIADLLRDTYPERSASIPLGNPGEGYVKSDYGWFPEEAEVTTLSSKKLEEAMGIKWIKFDQCILDTVKCFGKYL
jgi:nucleoside-diphosphate-sugar epimerase